MEAGKLCLLIIIIKKKKIKKKKALTSKLAISWEFVAP
jgi:hypothetical protein